MDYRELEELLGYDRPRYGDCHDAADPEILRRLSANDPAIQSLDAYFHDDRTAENHDWAKGLGLAISKSTHLRSLSIYDSPDGDGDDDDDDDDVQPPRTQYQYGWLSLFMGLAENRSIGDFSLYGFHHSRMDVFKTLAPFFEHNRNLHYIGIRECWYLGDRVPSLISALKQTHGLKLIDFSYNELEDSIAADLINALRSIPGLHHLLVLDLGGNKIGQQGCRALRELLRHPSCKIQCLDIGNNHLDNVCMDILYGGLVTNNSIKCIDIHRQKFVTASGWGVFFGLFPNSVCSLETIHAYRNDIGDNGVISLGDSLATSRKMKRIDLRNSHSITLLGWRGFSEGLTSPLCPLLELDISNCEITEEGAIAIASALGDNASLEKLDMSSNRSITSSGWIACFHLMRQNEIRLKQLDLSDNNIDDEGATMLVTILDKMSALDSFSLCEMTSVSSVGWQEFADVVNPNISSSKLRVLSLGKSHNAPPIDDSVIICFADALIGNTSLTTLSFSGYGLSEVGQRALANALCDTSSLVNTFLSNHTLQSTFYHRDLQSLLDMNECENKFEVARKKILASHFGDDDACRRIFAPMPFPTLPTALSWIGRDRREYSMMYNFLRGMLFDGDIIDGMRSTSGGDSFMLS
jgi:Ran GTPase-activating protein (RanGAP) involved in mRNA processing and transport